MQLKIKHIFKDASFYWLAVVLLTIKTYLMYKISFQIPAENPLQEVLLVINPISSAIILYAIALFFRNQVRNIMIVVLSLIGSLILYFNLLFYRFYADFITLPVLLQTNNVQDLSSSVVELIHFWDLFLFIDVVILAVLISMKKIPKVKSNRTTPLLLSGLAICIFLANLTIAQAERSQLLTRSFDRELLVKNIGMFNYHLYDIYLQGQTRIQRVMAGSGDVDEVFDYTRSNHVEPNEEMFGIAQGKNIVMIAMESVQEFVIDNDLNGEEITPFLNELKEKSHYFENFYHQTQQGKSSDAEFLVNTSMFARDSGAVFFTHAQNEYLALPDVLADEGYYSSVMHANNGSFWNRDIMYNALGYDHFYDLDYYEVNEENSIGWGLKDEHFFKQSLDLLKEQQQPFLTKFITLTNHFPFELEEEDRFIEEFDSRSGTLNRYFPTVRYTDYAIEQFFKWMKEEGLYEETIFILYGDHYGISENHNASMADYLEKDEITAFDTIQLQRVPLFLHIPGHEGKTYDTVSGQIDLKPTIMHLLGLETDNHLHFGTDLFSSERNPYTVLRNGSFITENYVFTDNTCYDKSSGKETNFELCEEFSQRAQDDLMYSDQILYGDLKRFIN